MSISDKGHLEAFGGWKASNTSVFLLVQTGDMGILKEVKLAKRGADVLPV